MSNIKPMPEKKAKKFKKKIPLHRKIVNIVSIFVIVLSVLTISFCALLISHPFKEKGKTVIPGVSVPSFTSEWNGTFTNFLVVGLDNAAHLTDVIMVISFDNQTGKISILQIPRDTYAGDDIPSYKYNAIYNSKKNVSGLENLKAHIERDFGIQIDHYAAITTKGLDDLVNSAGGVDLTVPMNMNYDDPVQNLHIHLKAGYQHLNGSQAEQFVRFRHGWTEGDIGRIKNAQQLFLAAFTKKLEGMSKLDLTTKVLPVLVSNNNFLTDMSGADMLKLGLSVKNINLGDMNVQVLPGEAYTYKGTSLYSAYKAPTVELLNKYFVPQGVVLNESDLKIIEISNKYENSNSSSSEDKSFENLINSQSVISSSKK